MIARWLFAFVGLASVAAPRFEPAGLCSLCHSDLASPSEPRVNVAPYHLWVSSMKANASLDPYWRAKVREETAMNAAAPAAMIEDKCLRCHAPAQQYPYRSGKLPMSLASLDSTADPGVTCSLCHQITATGFGHRQSFTAGFQIGVNDEIFGPHPDPFPMPMLHHTGYRPVEAAHMRKAELCATCHTVVTPILDEAGTVRGDFLEQAPFLEWLAGAESREGRSCLSCHMPELSVPVYIAHRPPGGPFPPTSPRSPFGRHSFAGGNVWGPAMLAELLPGLSAEFHETSARATELLSHAVGLSAHTTRVEQRLEVIIDVRNRTGHKLPTAYPSRRLWLHVKVMNAAGRVLFESGDWDPATSELRRAPADQPHYSRITRPDQVMIYEAEHADLQGNPTASLLRAARYRKDNRILPRGFDRKRVSLPDGALVQQLEPVAVASDPDFVPGSDRILYDIRCQERPARVVVEALYQSIKPGHARHTAAQPNEDASRFQSLYGRHGSPVVIATVDIPVTGWPLTGPPSTVSRSGSPLSPHIPEASPSGTECPPDRVSIATQPPRRQPGSLPGTAPVSDP